MKKDTKVLVFACNWCSYAGADLAGMMRLESKENWRIIRVMCSGRVGMDLVIYALIKGVGGVMVLGCHLGECHYLEGNYYTEKRGKLLKKILEFVGIGEEKVEVAWVSASEGKKFSSLVNKMVERLNETN